MSEYVCRICKHFLNPKERCLIPYIELVVDEVSRLVAPVCFKCQNKFKHMKANGEKFEDWPELVQMLQSKPQ